MTPAHEDECRQMLFTAFQQNSPCAVRYPRGKGIGILPQKEMQALAIGKGELLREGHSGIAILLFGSLLGEAQQAADSLDASLVNMRFVKPLDESLIQTMAKNHTLLVTLEDNAVQGGAGSAVNEYLAAVGLSVRVLNLGIPDTYIEHALREQQLVACELDAASLVRRIRASYAPKSELQPKLMAVPRQVAH